LEAHDVATGLAATCAGCVLGLFHQTLIGIRDILLIISRITCGAGSSKLTIRGLEVRDVAMGLAATPGTDAGGILVPWNPDESWANDAMIRVNAKVGTPTRSHAVYEHMEVLVHPLGVHLSEGVATSFWVSACNLCCAHD
jgi:hypothetical protein